MKTLSVQLSLCLSVSPSVRLLFEVANIPTQLLTHLTQMSRTVAKSQKGYQINAGPFSQEYQSPFKAQAEAQAEPEAEAEAEALPMQFALSLWGRLVKARPLPGCYQVLHLASQRLINFALAQVVRA